MSLYFVRHQHAPDRCPAKDPQRGAMLVQHIGSVQIYPASPCEIVVERQGC